MVKKASKIDLSIIVPVFNEEEGIEKTIIELFKDLKKESVKSLINSFEIIVINDGSWDGTDKALKSIKKSYPNIKIITHKINQGLGAALLSGVRHSSKAYITYLPADGQVFLREIPKGLKLAPFADLVLTYRGERADYNAYRNLLSGTLTTFMKLFFQLDFKDYNWVHIYKKSLFKHVNIKSRGVFYLGEVVIRTQNAGFKILEAEADYHPRSTGRSKNARIYVVLNTLKDLLKLWMDLKLRPYLK